MGSLKLFSTFSLITFPLYRDFTYCTSNYSWESESNAFATSMKVMNTGLHHEVQSQIVDLKIQMLSARPSPRWNAFCLGNRGMFSSSRDASNRWKRRATIVDTVIVRKFPGSLASADLGIKVVTSSPPCMPTEDNYSITRDLYGLPEPFYYTAWSSHDQHHHFQVPYFAAHLEPFPLLTVGLVHSFQTPVLDCVNPLWSLVPLNFARTQTE